MDVPTGTKLQITFTDGKTLEAKIISKKDPFKNWNSRHDVWYPDSSKSSFAQSQNKEVLLAEMQGGAALQSASTVVGCCRIEQVRGAWVSGWRETRGILTQSQPSQSAPPSPYQPNSPPPSVNSDFPTELLEKFDEMTISVFGDRRSQPNKWRRL